MDGANGGQLHARPTRARPSDFTVTGGPVVATPTPHPRPPTYGYWLVGSDGGIFTFGSAQFYGSTGNIALQRPVVGISPTANKSGYWLVASDGGIFAFGNAGYYGSIPGAGLSPAGSGLPHSLNAPIVGMVPSSDGGGYFMVASDGGVFAFGDARFEGSCPGMGGCSGAAVAVVPDGSGNGYWLVTQTGNVYAFGDAAFYGAPGNQGSPVTSAVRTADGHGYWVLLANGTVDAYGDAVARGGPVGSVGGFNPASAIFSDAGGGGYWVASAARWCVRVRRRPQRRVDGREPPQRLHHRRDGFLSPFLIATAEPARRSGRLNETRCLRRPSLSVRRWRAERRWRCNPATPAPHRPLPAGGSPWRGAPQPGGWWWSSTAPSSWWSAGPLSSWWSAGQVSPAESPLAGSSWSMGPSSSWSMGPSSSWSMGPSSSSLPWWSQVSPRPSKEAA